MELQELLFFPCTASITAILFQDREKWFSRNWSSSFLCCKGSYSFPGQFRGSGGHLLWACSIPGPLAALLRTLHQGNHSSALSDALLSSQPITLALGNVSLVTGGIWNFQQFCAIRCDTAPLFSADGSVLCLQEEGSKSGCYISAGRKSL